MRRVLVAPFFYVDSVMYEAALDALISRAPLLAYQFTWERFACPMSWRFIPNIHYPETEPYKAESRFFERYAADKELSLSVWRSPATRQQGKLLVHNHSGTVRREMVLGECAEDRYESLDDRIHEALDCRYETGEVGTLEPHMFHEVTGIFVPWRTMILSESEHGEGGVSEYLDIESGAILSSGPTRAGSSFTELFNHWNPHLRR